MSNSQKLQETLAKIAHLATGAIVDGGAGDDSPPSDGLFAPGCTVKSLPARLQIKAANYAVEVNPVNSPMMQMPGAAFSVMEPLQLAVLTAKYWGPTPRRLTVSFMETTPANLRARIVQHMNAWSKTSCVTFVETTGTGQVRISREGAGFWSYLGTDIRLIPTNRPTMNLQRFSMQTIESEYRRVVRHETGHTLGFPHEHMRKELIARIDRQKAYRYFLQTQGWNAAMVDAQVLTPLDDRTIMSTPPDQTSIMCYQLPGSITKDGKPILGGTDINATDFGFAGKIYPIAGRSATEAPLSTVSHDDDWDEDDDVDPSSWTD